MFNAKTKLATREWFSNLLTMKVPTLIEKLKNTLRKQYINKFKIDDTHTSFRKTNLCPYEHWGIRYFNSLCVIMVGKYGF